MSLPLFEIYQIQPDNIKNNRGESIPGFIVNSTAPLNIDTDPAEYNGNFEQNNPDLKKIPDVNQAIKIITSKLQPDSPGQDFDIVVAVHGYNMSRQSTKDWYSQMYHYVNTGSIGRKASNAVFIGYRWPSERIKGDPEQIFGQKFQDLFAALPIVPKSIFFGSVGLAILGLIGFAFLAGIWQGLVIILTLLTAAMVGLIGGLILLRFVGYFRDTYRALHYGVPDLVELFRQLDKNIVEATIGDSLEQKYAYWEKHRIRLSFIGHSMGGQVVTNTVRILSDVFDPRSVGNLTNVDSDKNPSSRIGHTFELSRLILASPDIPIDTIVTGRTNFLSASLRRFEEVYLFCNDGDLALRLASTTANYFSYPANTVNQGQRLGNVKINNKGYGIINLQDLFEKKYQKPNYDIFKAITISDKSVFQLRQEKLNSKIMPDTYKIAQAISIFDCTDYTDRIYRIFSQNSDSQVKLLSNSLKKPTLNFIDLSLLSIQYFFFGKDVHSAYFDGELSQELIYSLAFIGFDNYLNSLAKSTDQTQNLQTLSLKLRQKNIQLLLSPERYKEGILQKNKIMVNQKY